MSSNKGSTLTDREKRSLAAFVRYASTEWARSQYELAEAAGISQSMIAYVVSGNRPAGGRRSRDIRGDRDLARGYGERRRPREASSRKDERRFARAGGAAS